MSIVKIVKNIFFILIFNFFFHKLSLECVPTEGHSWGFSFKSWTHSYKLSDKLWTHSQYFCAKLLTPS